MTSEWNRPRLLAHRRHRSVPLLLAVAFLGEHYQAAENLLGDIVERQTKTQSKGVVSVANGLEKGRGIHHLARGLVLLEEAELKARRDAEQMVKSLAGLREALDKVRAINEESWSADAYNIELTRALTAIENARMEWNGARLKWPVLDGALASPNGGTAPAGPAKIQGHFLGAQSFGELCRLGFALTWPVALAVLLGVGLLLLLKK